MMQPWCNYDATMIQLWYSYDATMMQIKLTSYSSLQVEEQNLAEMLPGLRELSTGSLQNRQRAFPSEFTACRRLVEDGSSLEFLVAVEDDSPFEPK